MNWENGYASEAVIQFALRYKQYEINWGRKCKICINEGETDEESKCELVCYGCFAPFHKLICPSKMGWPLGMHKSKLQSDDSCRRGMYCETCYKANVFFCAWCGHHLEWRRQTILQWVFTINKVQISHIGNDLISMHQLRFWSCHDVTVLLMDAHICTSSNVQTAWENN